MQITHGSSLTSALSNPFSPIVLEVNVGHKCNFPSLTYEFSGSSTYHWNSQFYRMKFNVSINNQKCELMSQLSLTPPPPKVTSCCHRSRSKSTNFSFNKSWPLQSWPVGALVPLTVVGVYWHVFGLTYRLEQEQLIALINNIKHCAPNRMLGIVHSAYLLRRKQSKINFENEVKSNAIRITF